MTSRDHIVLLDFNKDRLKDVKRTIKGRSMDTVIEYLLSVHSTVTRNKNYIDKILNIETDRFLLELTGKGVFHKDPGSNDYDRVRMVVIWALKGDWNQLGAQANAFGDVDKELKKQRKESTSEISRRKRIEQDAERIEQDLESAKIIKE